MLAEEKGYKDIDVDDAERKTMETLAPSETGKDNLALCATFLSLLFPFPLVLLPIRILPPWMNIFQVKFEHCL